MNEDASRLILTLEAVSPDLAVKVAASALAKAWDEGAAAPRMVDGSEEPAVDNPYRSEA